MMDKSKKYSDETRKEEDMKEVEPVMGLKEFGQTEPVNPVLLAGFQRHCDLINALKRQTRTQWQAGLAAWAARAAN